MAETKTFLAKELKDMGLPGDPPEGGEIIEDRIIEKTRWSVVYGLIFRLPGQPDGEAYRAIYRVGATEEQDEQPWEYDKEVECRIVHRKEKMIIVWE